MRAPARPSSDDSPLHAEARTRREFLAQEGEAFSDDLRGVLSTLYARRWVFLGVFLAVVLAAAVWLRFTVPQYTATAVVMLDPRKQVVTNSPEVLPDLDPVASVIDTQAQVIHSRTIVGMAVDKVGLRRAAGALPEDATRAEVIEQVQNGLDVARVGLTLTLRISATDPDPAVAAELANAISTSYLEFQVDAKRKATREANLWLRQRVEELRTEVDSAEARADRYRSRSGLLVAKGATSTESQVTTLDLGLNDARQALADAQARLTTYAQTFRDHGAAEAAKIVVSPSMQQLRDQFTGLANQRAQLSTTLGPLHPQMVELRQQIATVQEQMNGEAQRTVGQLQNDVAIARSKVDGLETIRNESRTRLMGDNAANVELTQMQTRAQALREQYESTLARLQQTDAQETLGQVNVTVLSEALPPDEPSSPRTHLVLAGALVTGVALGCLAVLLVQVLSSTILRPKDLERQTKLPVLALVPRLRRSDLRIDGRRFTVAEAVQQKPLSLYAEAFRTSRVAVQNSLGARRSVVLQITSGTFAEGKTRCSIAYAQAAALDGRRVLLVDADVRRRSLTEYLGIKAEIGLMELLHGKANMRDVIIQASGTRQPYVLPLSATESGLHDRFSGGTFKSLLERLRPAFDLIIFDSAPVLAVAESLALSKNVDGVIVVAKWASTPSQIVLKAIEEIDRAGGNVVGTLLTQVDIRRVSRQAYGRRHYTALKRYYQH
jgi:capsular exopolysaccharide synthesis family protein